ncbi:hypothetical protein HK102_007566 [Quaeritorhiza haematococci]|nr:hypothetical protein HK102_007566 [Quaeritorhiza haematococci]
MVSSNPFRASTLALLALSIPALLHATPVDAAPTPVPNPQTDTAAPTANLPPPSHSPPASNVDINPATINQVKQLAQSIAAWFKTIATVETPAAAGLGNTHPPNLQKRIIPDRRERMCEMFGLSCDGVGGRGPLVLSKRQPEDRPPRGQTTGGNAHVDVDAAAIQQQVLDAFTSVVTAGFLPLPNSEAPTAGTQPQAESAILLQKRSIYPDERDCAVSGLPDVWCDAMGMGRRRRRPWGAPVSGVFRREDTRNDPTRTDGKVGAGVIQQQVLDAFAHWATSRGMLTDPQILQKRSILPQNWECDLFGGSFCDSERSGRGPRGGRFGPWRDLVV